MKFPFGFDASALKRNERREVVWDTSRLVNGHTLLVGMSGAGKTTQLKMMISHMQNQSRRVRFHVFDVHGDIDIPGASEMLYSEQTPYGLNPLRVNPDPHFGGVRKCISNFIRTVSRASVTPLGVKQEAVLRNILTDVYRMRGFHPDLPETWHINEFEECLVTNGTDRLYLDVPISEKDEAKSLGARWDSDMRCWWVKSDDYHEVASKWTLKTVGRANPNLNDVIIYAQRLLKVSFMGSDQESISRLEDFHRAVRSFRSKELEAARRKQKFEDDFATNELEKAKGKALDSYRRYVDAVRTGNEFDDLIRYDSTDVLKSCLDRLESLRASGIFKSTVAPFDENTPVWTYRLAPLERSEKKMFVMFRLQELFNAALQRGEVDEVLDVLVLDEVQLYADEDPDSILNVLSREARKFGVCMLAANQNADLPEAFLSSLATKVVLGIDELYWKKSVAKMRIEETLLEWIQHHKTIAVQMKEKGATKNLWRWVVLPSAH